MTAWDLFQLRRLLECREPGARVVAEDVVARITYLGFFRKYHHLAGAATSVRGIGRELARLYGLRVQHRRVRLRPRRSVYRCRVLPDRDALVGLLARPAADAKKERRLLVVVANSAGERDDFLDRFHRAGFEGAADLERGDDDTLAPTPGIRVTILREFLPFCADSSLFESFYRVDVYFVGLPPSSRQLRECAMPTLHGRTKGELWQLMTAVGEHENDTAAAPLPLGRLGPLAASRATRLLVRPLLQLALRARERAEAETRAAVLSHQASIDELFAFSGRGRT
ncbi:MAG: hypothetical protein DWQ08_12105 [Proteobacteria bacterium]|nr:MAG: hypothetical protein DWQ08_12105 [Pseudomonadota bacterium]